MNTTIEQELRDRGRCLIQTVGVSMEPLLHNRYSSVVLEPVGESLRENDVVLFQRDESNAGEAGAYVLHRIVGFCPKGYVIRGDNCLEKEYVSRNQIIGVMTGFFNGEDYVDCARDKKYRRYVRSLNVRYAWRFTRAFLGRVKRRIL